MHYTQCLLKRNGSYKVAWIPSTFAKIGKYIKINELDGWQVIQMWSTHSEEMVLEYERDYAHHREQTDV